MRLGTSRSTGIDVSPLEDDHEDDNADDDADRDDDVVHERVGRIWFDHLVCERSAHHRLCVVVLYRIGRQFDTSTRSVIRECDRLISCGIVGLRCSKSRCSLSKLLSHHINVDKENFLKLLHRVGSTHFAGIETTSGLVVASMHQLEDTIRHCVPAKSNLAHIPFLWDGRFYWPSLAGRPPEGVDLDNCQSCS